MTDQTTSTAAAAPSPPPTPPAAPAETKPLHRFPRLHRFLSWARDYESTAAREHYITFGIWSSRIYALALFAMIPLLSWLNARVSDQAMLWVTLGWCVLWSHIYLWYQGKEIVAYPVVQEDHANQDLMNSILPAISIGILFAAWVLIKFFHAMAWTAFEFTYTEYGWIVLLNGVFDVVYDLRINTKVTFILSKIPGRMDYGAPQPPQH